MTYVPQVGGDHYQAAYQHWDWVIDLSLGYLEGNATKYVSRWRKKAGLPDLQKSMTYVEKLIAAIQAGKMQNHPTPTEFTEKCTERFLESVEGNREKMFIRYLSEWRTEHDVRDCKALLEIIIAVEIERQVANKAAQGSAGQAVAPPAPTIAPTPTTGALPPRHGAAQGTAGRGAGGSGPTAEQISKARGLQGLEHPFGYEGDG